VKIRRELNRKDRGQLRKGERGKMLIREKKEKGVNEKEASRDPKEREGTKYDSAETLKKKKAIVRKKKPVRHDPKLQQGKESQKKVNRPDGSSQEGRNGCNSGKSFKSQERKGENTGRQHPGKEVQSPGAVLTERKGEKGQR